MNTEPELLNERLERLAIVLDEIMPQCALLVRDALALLKQGAVVRCKDCALRYTNKCVLHDQAFPVNKPNDWFCADGERRTDDA